MQQQVQDFANQTPVDDSPLSTTIRSGKLPARRLWLTWERQRRSVELSRHYNCELVEIVENGRLRYAKSLLRTMRVLRDRRATVVFAQNPSMLLAAAVTLWGLATGALTIIDRHSTFMLNRAYKPSLGLFVFKTLNRFTLKFADITVVTNDFLAALVRDFGGRPFVLPDKLPSGFQDSRVASDDKEGVTELLFVCSFADDEPIDEVIDAVALAKHVKPRVFISGNIKRASPRILAKGAGIVEFTGFLPEEEYIRLLSRVHGVIVLTTADHTMLCGCYEAVAACKPLITSDKSVLRNYFTRATFVDNSSGSIAEAICQVATDRANLAVASSQMKVELQQRWNAAATSLSEAISTLETNRA